jgi:hypothetical protein
LNGDAGVFMPKFSLPLKKRGQYTPPPKPNQHEFRPLEPKVPAGTGFSLLTEWRGQDHYSCDLLKPYTCGVLWHTAPKRCSATLANSDWEEKKRRRKEKSGSYVFMNVLIKIVRP